MTSVIYPRVGKKKLSMDANRLKVFIIGTPEIIATGLPLNLNHLKAQALLYYLAATGKAFTRDHLATLLWSDAGSSEALHSLRSSLYRLRQGLRSRGTSTVPSTLEEEKQTNPFLRWDSKEIQASVKSVNPSTALDPVSVFAAVRKMKDSF